MVQFEANRFLLRKNQKQRLNRRSERPRIHHSECFSLAGSVSSEVGERRRKKRGRLPQHTCVCVSHTCGMLGARVAGVFSGVPSVSLQFFCQHPLIVLLPGLLVTLLERLYGRVFFPPTACTTTHRQREAISGCDLKTIDCCGRFAPYLQWEMNKQCI